MRAGCGSSTSTPTASAIREEASAAGLLDERQADGVLVIEWADRLDGWLPAERLEIRLDTRRMRRCDRRAAAGGPSARRTSGWRPRRCAHRDHRHRRRLERPVAGARRPRRHRSSATKPGPAPSASRPSCCRACWRCSRGSSGRCTTRRPSPSASGPGRSPASGWRWPWPRGWPSACDARSSACRASRPGSMPSRTRRRRRAGRRARGVPAGARRRPCRASSIGMRCDRAPRVVVAATELAAAFGLDRCAPTPRGARHRATRGRAARRDPAGDDLRTLEPIYLRAPRGVAAESGELVRWL